MSDTPNQEELQPKAKNDPPIKPKKSSAVVIYLVILFAAAFLLLLMAYFQQQRSTDEVIGNLQNSVSQFQTANELMKENQQLREELEQLEEQANQLQDSLTAAQQENTALTERNQMMEIEYDHEFIRASCWEIFWEIEQLYQTEQYEACASAIKALARSTFYYTPEDAQSRANEIWEALMDMGLLVPEDSYANTFYYTAP